MPKKRPHGPHPVDVHVGARLRLRRKMMGLSQSALGTKVGVTFQQVQKYENGTNRISAGRLHDFANILDVPISFFFDGYDEFEQPRSPIPIISPETLATAAFLEHIPDAAKKRSIRALIKALAQNMEPEDE